MDQENMTRRLFFVIIAMVALMVFCFVIGKYFEHKALESHSNEQNETLMKALAEELQDKMNPELETIRQDKGDSL